jgi:hypothetical protein
MPDPNNIILRDNKLALALPCKCANTSVKLALLKQQQRDVPEPDNPPQYGVHKADLFEYVALREVPDDFRIVGVMREPLARVLSIYAFTHNRPQTFAQWIQRQAIRSDRDVDQHERSQLYEFMVDGELKLSAVMFVETLEADWRALENLMGWNGPGGIAKTNTLEENGCQRVAVPDIPELAGSKTNETWRSLYARYGQDFFAYDILSTIRTSNIARVANEVQSVVALAEMPTSGSVS